MAVPAACVDHVLALVSCCRMERHRHTLFVERWEEIVAR